MRTANPSWLQCVLVSVVAASAACATASGDSSIDGGGGGGGSTGLVVPDAGHEGGGGGVVVVTGGGDSGLPTVTVSGDGGRSTLNPEDDADTSEEEAGTTGGFDSSFPPPSGDAGFPSGGDGGMTYPMGDGGYHHHHHDGGFGMGSGSGTSSGTGSAGGVPTTCSEANGATGCCDGDVRYYCSGGTVASDDCSATPGRTCGWSDTFQNFGCVDDPGTPPSGTSMTCGSGSTGSGTGTGGSAPTTCAAADGEIGCCSGDTNYYCTTNTGTDVKSTACPSGTTCGWGTDTNGDSYYGCVQGSSAGADPSGEYPLACQ